MRSPSKSSVVKDAKSNFNLPPGFRFHPTDEELIVHYLSRKSHSTSPIIADVDIYKHEPWDLPGTLLILLSIYLYIHLVISNFCIDIMCRNGSVWNKGMVFFHTKR